MCGTHPRVETGLAAGLLIPDYSIFIPTCQNKNDNASVPSSICDTRPLAVSILTFVYK